MHIIKRCMCDVQFPDNENPSKCQKCGHNIQFMFEVCLFRLICPYQKMDTRIKDLKSSEYMIIYAGCGHYSYIRKNLILNDLEEYMCPCPANAERTKQDITDIEVFTKDFSQKTIPKSNYSIFIFKNDE